MVILTIKKKLRFPEPFHGIRFGMAIFPSTEEGLVKHARRPCYNASMNIVDIGEVALIQRLIDMAREAGLATASSLLVGPGDDAAAWRLEAGTALSTTDTVVESVHFTRKTIPWRDLGWKVMAVNLSDIAAMGGTPLYALVTLGLPPDTPVADVEELYRGLIDSCREYSVAIAGGDAVASPTAFISIVLNGTHHGAPLLRSQAAQGDLLAVTGPLGSSQGGLELLTAGEAGIDKAAYEHLSLAHRHPVPRLDAGHILVDLGVRAAMDISDGLVEDLARMMEASGSAARVDAWRVPMHPLLVDAFQERALTMALSGGEDYELLYAAPPALMDSTLPRIPEATVIGSVVEGPVGQVSVVDQQGKELPLSHRGWNHFRP